MRGLKQAAERLGISDNVPHFSPTKNGRTANPLASNKAVLWEFTVEQGIPMRRGFLYLVAIMDWYSRKVLSWRLSNTLDADFCVVALEEALKKIWNP